jgi:hypothetical protein
MKLWWTQVWNFLITLIKVYLTWIFLSQALVLIKKEGVVPEYFTLFAQARLE